MNLELSCANVVYYENFINNELGKILFDQLFDLMVDESVQKVSRYDSSGNEIGLSKLNRKTGVFVLDEILDRYVTPKIWGNDVLVEEFTPELIKLKKIIESTLNYSFNICLVNYYENGKKAIGWHSDNEEKGSIECIASVSLGCSRDFSFRDKVTKEVIKTIKLDNCSLLVMDNGCQDNYEHCLVYDKQCKDIRINITFRHFKVDTYSSLSNVTV